MKLLAAFLTSHPKGAAIPLSLLVWLLCNASAPPMLKAQDPADASVTILVDVKNASLNIDCYLNKVKLLKVLRPALDLLKVEIPVSVIQPYIGNRDTLLSFIKVSFEARNRATQRPLSILKITIAKFPEDTLRSKYMGKWQGESVKLLINQDVPPEVVVVR